MIELGQCRAHAVIAKSAGMVCRRDKVRAQCVHLRQRTYHTGIAEVISKCSACEARAGCRLNSDDSVICFTSEFLTHERSDQAAEVGSAACAADDDVGLYAELIKGSLRLQTDHRLVEKYLVQNGTEHIAVTFSSYSNFNSLGDRAAEGTCGTRVLFEDRASDVRRIGRRRCNRCAVCTHNFTAERLLLVGNLNHIDFAIEIKVRASHGKSCTPLASTCLGGNTLEALLLSVVSLCDRGVQFMGTAGVITFELIVDLRRSSELLLKEVSTYQRRRTIHLIELQDLFRDREISRIVIELLLDELIAEYRAQFLGLHRLMCTWVEKRCRLVLHVRTHVVPRGWDLLFVKVGFVRNFLRHNLSPFVLLGQILLFCRKNKNPAPASRFCWDRNDILSCGATRLDLPLLSLREILSRIPTYAGRC